MDIILDRFCYGPHGTFGHLTVPEPYFTCYTVERPDLDNQRNVSCIPEGRYSLLPRMYNRGGYDAIELLDVPGRSHILIHKGNTMFDVKGCIAVGDLLGSLGQPQIWAVLNSSRTFDYFMEIYNPDEHTHINIRFNPVSG